jgi:hypothetical protein
VTCGTCTAPQTCGGGGTPNVCGSVVVDPCSPLTGDTLACITSRNKPGQPASIQCLACATDNGCFDPLQQGGTCEMLTTAAPAACGPVIGTGAAASEKQVCLSTLKQIFSSQCAATGQETPCLCGATDAGQCLAGTAAPQGPLLPTYTCDLGATVSTILSNFTVPTFGAGMGNGIAGCAAAFGCDCF